MTTIPEAAGLSGRPAFPADLGAWLPAPDLLGTVEAAAVRACGASWLNLLNDAESGPGGQPDLVLVLLAYCYLSGVYNSLDVVRRLATDEALAGLRDRLVVEAAELRRFRREHRRSLTDCLTHALVAMWKRWASMGDKPALTGKHGHNRLNFKLLEPFYLQAQDRVDRAVILDSMALDY